METPPSTALRILMVELDIDEYSDVKKWLSNTPLRQAHLTLVTSYEEALSFLETFSCSLILLSTRIGEKRLLRLLHELHLHGTHVPTIVFSTRHDSESLVIKVLEKGVEDVLAKEELTPQSLHRAFSFATARNQLKESLREQSMTDVLTTLLNRRGFLDLGNNMLSYAARHQLKVTLLMIDLNGFKRINDQFGHPIGDKALQMVAQCLKEATRKHDLIARLGGDEFVILVIHQNGDPSDRIYQHLLDRVEECNHNNPEGFKLSLSLGAQVFNPTQPLSLEKMIESVDRHLYAMKKKDSI
jgi:diguanylate cyclase